MPTLKTISKKEIVVNRKNKPFLAVFALPLV
jgi:hypothetical protein